MNRDYQGLAWIHIKNFRGVEKYLTGVRGNQTSKQSVEAKLICEHQLIAVEKNLRPKKVVLHSLSKLGCSCSQFDAP